MSYNLKTFNDLKNKIDIQNVNEWFKEEISEIDEIIQDSIMLIYNNIDTFCKFPLRASLMLDNCDRCPPSKGKKKYHKYPDRIKLQAKKLEIKLDTRPNGPAVAAFEIAGGKRPLRYGSTNSWHIHHIYSGKFPYIGKDTTLHAVKESYHFTQSAGLVALHPLADALADEYPAFSWLLRFKSYNMFKYDPDGVFSKSRDSWGFEN